MKIVTRSSWWSVSRQDQNGVSFVEHPTFDESFVETFAQEVALDVPEAAYEIINDDDERTIECTPPVAATPAWATSCELRNLQLQGLI